MMFQGVFGVFPFMVTDSEVSTFRDLSRKRQIAFAEHKVIAGLPKLQHVGRELDELSLQVILHPIVAGGISVDARLLALRLLASTGQELPLVLGLAYFGMFVLKNVDVKHTIFHGGATWSATADLTFAEYN